MRKSNILFVLLFAFFQFGFSQEGFIERVYQDFISQETISYISFSEDFLAEMAEEDKHISNVASRLLTLQILKSDTSDLEVNDELYTRVISAVHHEGYELLTEMKSEEVKTHFYRKENDKKKRTSEILMISQGYDGCLLISAVGEEININQLKKLSTR